MSILSYIAVLPQDQPICVFWDFSLAEGRGGWSDKGCTLTSHSQVTSQDATVVCTCDHLTNFAVIFVSIFS